MSVICISEVDLSVLLNPPGPYANIECVGLIAFTEARRQGAIETFGLHFKEVKQWGRHFFHSQSTLVGSELKCKRLITPGGGSKRKLWIPIEAKH